MNAVIVTRCSSVERRRTLKDKRLSFIWKVWGFRSIGRFLKVSHVAVYQWIRGLGERLEELRSANEIEIVEMDEMHTTIGSKKIRAGSGLLLIVLGESSSSARLVHATRRPEEASGKK